MGRYRYSFGVAVAPNPLRWCLLPRVTAQRDTWPRIYTVQWLFLFVAVAKGVAHG